MTTKTNLSVLALAAAAFTTTLLANGSASANFSQTFRAHEQASSQAIAGAEQGDHRVGATEPAHIFLPPWLKVRGGNGGAVPHKGEGGSGGEVVSCRIGTGCTVTGGDRDRDHDRDHDHDYDRDHHDYDHDRDDYYHWHRWDRWYGWYYNRWYGWRDRPEIVVEGAPGVVAVPTPVAAQSAPAPVRATAARAPLPAAPQAAQGPCNCLTKQSMPDGSVVFQDICTKESAVAPPKAADAR
jgi:hypothetical protein